MSKLETKLALYTTATCLGLGIALSGTSCGKKVEVISVEQDTTTENTPTEQDSTKALEKAKVQSRTFDAEKHLFSKRFSLNAFQYDWSNTIEIPDGYKVYAINYVVTEQQNFTWKTYSFDTTGYDVWYQNEVPVVVDGIWNKDTKNYDYNTFGKPLENTEEKQPQKVK